MNTNFGCVPWSTSTTCQGAIASRDCPQTRDLAARWRAGFWLLAIVMPFGNVVVCVAAPPARDAESSGVVHVTLHPPSRIRTDVLCIADVAELSGGSESLRQRIAELDVEEAPAVANSANSLNITAQQIEFRLRLAGIDPRLVTINGSTARASAAGSSARPASAAIKPGQSPGSALRASRSRVGPVAIWKLSNAEQVVLDAARECLKTQLPWSEENLEVQLAQPLPRALNEALSTTGTTCVAEWRSGGTPLGQVVLRIVFQTEDERVVDVPVRFDVRHFEEVVVTTKPLAQGHILTASDLERARRDVTEFVGFSTTPDTWVGQQVKRILPAGHVVRAVDVAPEPRTASALLVKRRDRVKAIARSGALLVVMSAEALQDGRAGELIKVRNLDSNAVVVGRVLSATEVEVTE